MKVILLTAQLALACLPLMSAYAESVAYLKYTKDFWQVHIKDTETGEDRQATSTDYDKTRVSWVGKNKMFVNGVQGQMTIVDLSSGEEKPLPLISSHVNDAVLSKDGRYILYSTISDTSDLNRLYILDRNSDKNTALPKREGLQFDPAWSSDGRHFYFVAGDNRGPYSLWQSSLDGGDQRPVVKNRHHNLDINESSGGILAYSSNQAGNYDIWINENGQTRQLTEYEGYDGKPNWSGDGKTVYFESTRNGVVNIWSMTVDDPDTKAWHKPVQITHSDQGARLPVVYVGDQVRDTQEQ